MASFLHSYIKAFTCILKKLLFTTYIEMIFNFFISCALYYYYYYLKKKFYIHIYIYNLYLTLSKLYISNYCFTNKI